ncbi:hypothetical protein V8E36_001907 [Tilletia maclaganii]
MVPADGRESKTANRITARCARIGKASCKHVRLALPALFASFVLAVLFMVRPVSDWSGPFSFLVFFHLHFLFFPSPLTVGANIQSALLGLLGSSVGCGVGLLCVAIALWIDGEQDISISGIDYTPYVSDVSRAFAACSLLVVSFLCGLLLSSVPRLNNFSRICLFNLCWIITRGSADRRTDYQVFGEFFHPSVLSAGAGVLANLLIFPKTAVNILKDELLSVFELLGILVEDSIQLFFSGTYDATAMQAITGTRQRFTAAIARLPPTFEAASSEIAFIRVPSLAFEPYLKVLQRSRDWIAGAIEVEMDEDGVPNSAGLAELESPVRTLAVEVANSITIIRFSILLVSDRRLSDEQRNRAKRRASKTIDLFIDKDPKAEPGLAHQAVLQQRSHLAAAIERLKHELQIHLEIQTPMDLSDSTPETPRQADAYLDEMQLADHDDSPGTADHRRMPSGPLKAVELSSRMYAGSYLILCLIEIAQLCVHALATTQNVLRLWHGSGKRHIQWPWSSLHRTRNGISSWAWRRWASHAGPGTLNDLIGSLQTERYGLDTDHLFADDQDNEGGQTLREEAEAEAREKQKDKPDPSEQDTRLSRFDIFAEPDRVLAAVRSDSLGAHANVEKLGSGSPPLKRTPWHRIQSIPNRVLRICRTKEAMTIRIALSELIASFKNSRHLRFAFKLSMGCLLLTLPAWLPSSTSREWWYGERGQWALISYVWCLETSTGATVRVSTFRLIGTISGSIYGFLMFEICGTNPYGLTVFIVLAEFFVAYMMLETTAQGIGIVFALTFPIIALIPYLGLPYTSVALLAWERGFMVVIGILTALIVNLMIWPFHARVQLVLHIARATSRLQRLYLSLSRQMLNTDLVTSKDTRRAFESLERSILKTLSQSRSLIALMSVEVSLVPKPTILLGKIIDHLARIADLLVGLRLCRQHGMKGKLRKHLVLNVLEYRTELTSAILISFFAVGASIRNRTPCPQFLPSPRAALDELTASLLDGLSSNDLRRSHRHHDRVSESHPPDAYHALSNLHNRRPGWRRFFKSRSNLGSHSRSPTEQTPEASLTPRGSLIHSPPPGRSLLQAAFQNQSNLAATAAGNASASGAGAAAVSHMPSIPSPPASAPALGPEIPRHHSAQAPPRLAYFFILAEHSLLAQIVSELEHVLELTRKLVGTATVLEMAYDERLDDHSQHPLNHTTWHSMH